MIIIPTYQNVSPRYSIDIELSGVMYTLQFNWNSRDSAWYMNIILLDTIVFAGLKLVTGYALLYQYKATPNLPDGEFFVIDNQDQNQYDEDLSYDNFGVRYSLVFVPTEEL